MDTASQSTPTTKTVTLGTSRLGFPEPRIEVQMPKGTRYRALSATLHTIAAAVELATGEEEGWVVVIEVHSDEQGRVCLDLDEATDAEAARGVALLKKLLV